MAGFAQSPDDFRILDDHDESVTHPMLIEGRRWWERARGDRAMPGRQDFDPVKAPPAMLPHILLADVVWTPRLRFRYRLIGTHITQAMGRDSTGRWFDDLYNEYEYGTVTASIMRAIETGRPVSTLARAPADERSFLRIEAVDMPLAANGKDVDMIMSLCDIRNPAAVRSHDEP